MWSVEKMEENIAIVLLFGTLLSAFLVLGAVEGYLNEGQLDYMRHCLQTYPEHNAIIVFHHQPVPVGSRWLDNLGLKNADQFWYLVSGFPKIKVVLFGHVHQEFEKVVHGIPIYSLPSTCIQFKPQHDEFSLDNIPPGYRWFNLFEDGHIETGVERIAKYVGDFDKEAKGY